MRRTKKQRVLAAVLAAVMLCSSGLSGISINVEAAPENVGNQDTFWSSTWHYYCIDHSGIAANGHGNDGDLYQCFAPSAGLSSEETAVIFWATLSHQASVGNMPKVSEVYNTMNTGASAAGLPSLTPMVTQDDLGTLLHLESTRRKYSWLDSAVANADKYLAMAGWVGGGGGSGSGAATGVPSVLEGHTTKENAYTVDPNSLTISFDPSGKDRDFIRTVPLKFWNGSEYVPEIPSGWNCEKTDTEIIFHTTDPSKASLQLMFDTAGTQYGIGAGGAFSSPEELYENTLELWLCVQCSGTHKNVAGGTAALDTHQRCVFLNIPDVPGSQASYYASIGTRNEETEGSLEFKIYRHEEDWETNYNVQLYKYDHETGKPLEGSIFRLYERFDDRDQISDEDGYGAICRGGDEPYLSYHRDDTVTWDGFRFISSLNTDEEGYISQTVNHGYHYEKTFCDGHPQPTLAEVPEGVEDGNGGITNQDEIDAAEEENANLQEAWQACVDACEEYAEQYPGVHFHWLNEDGTESASGEEAFEMSGCKEDADTTYGNFTALRYSYAFQEDEAREGYALHGIHADDLPVEIIRTDSSENGANSEFAGEYSGTITASSSSRISRNKEAKVVKMEKQYYPAEEQTTFQYQERPAENYVHPMTVLKDEMEEETATPSNAEKATPSNAETSADDVADDMQLATPSDAQPETKEKTAFYFQRNHAAMADSGPSGDAEESDESDGAELFETAYEEALSSESVGNEVEAGPSDNYSHCNDADGEGNAWRVYDHRTEGEIHINKRDMELEDGESAGYDSYGESQADATLEGAVYGLFAAEDIVHPDGKTGVVYKAGNLVAVAATDKNGDASFLVNTEKPGQTYDYGQGKVVDTDDGFAAKAPANLYTADISYDDYEEDGRYERVYMDNASDNGSCWIGRPLLLGEYYVKELSRSEGYELSVSNKDGEVTNKGQDLSSGVIQTVGDGSAVITKNLFYEVRPSETADGSYGDADYNELFYFARSEKTGTEGFDVLLGNLPEGTKAYRAETGKKTVEVDIPYGDYKEVPVVDENGTPVYVTVQEGEEGKYPKYNADGSMMSTEKTVNLTVRNFKMADSSAIDPELSEEAFRESTGSMDEAEVQELLEKNFSISSKLFVKAKLEAALRANGKRVPVLGSEYSSPDSGIYDRGERGTSISYGSPVQKVSIPKTVDGQKTTTEEALWALLEYYDTNPWFNYGGLEDVEENGDSYVFTLYASVSGHPANFVVTEPGGIVTIYHRLEYNPADNSHYPRYVYVPYTDADTDAFGGFKDLTVRHSGTGTDYYTAVLVPDSTINGEGMITAKTVKENVYYQAGETPYDALGRPIQKTEWRQDTRKETVTSEEKVWKEIPVQSINGKLYAHVEGTYTDQFGNQISDMGEPADHELRLAVPERLVTLTQEDVEGNDDGWSAGDTVGGGAYYRIFRQAYVKAYLKAREGLDSTGSYIKEQNLRYPGEHYPWQDGEGIPGSDGNTRKAPAGVQERIIKQKIKVAKDIDTVFQKQNGQAGNTAAKLPNFRFKAYLKSNLTSLYRDADGEVVWIDKKGNEVDIQELLEEYPGMVPRIHTKVLHDTEPIHKDSYDAAVANTALYSYVDGVINEKPNEGYTALLETVTRTAEDGAGTRKVEAYDYDKFFDAIRVANKDKWDDAAPTYTSWQPIGNEKNRIEETLENAKVSDMVRQFAIDWYLDDEVAKLTMETEEQELEGKDSAAYSGELTDRALYQAIQKAQNYLKPFFSYDLDEIYAVAWDGENDGGADKDMDTLACNEDFGGEEGYYCGISSYLPYGIYVVAEQQPQYDNLLDFANKHYETDKPKEVTVPSVYDSYAGSQESPEVMNGYYDYIADMGAAELESRYHIRFLEEDHVISAHSHFGDFEVYKYGIDTDLIRQGMFFELTQSQYRPYKNYYNGDDIRKETENEYYIAGKKSGNKMVSGFYRFSSESEDAGREDSVPFAGGTETEDNVPGIFYKDNVKTMKGSLTAYDGKYASMLVPYAVTAPAGTDTEESETQKEASGESSYTGYAYGKLRNRFYVAKLRIEKLDSETHENVLHDDAIFNIYKAQRQESPNGQGEVLFYEEDTTISGTKEFLESMGAENIQPVERKRSFWNFFTIKETGVGNLYTGVVPSGTPICREEDQVIQGKDSGEPAMVYKSYSTILDGKMQAAGYVETPQPLGAGVYVIAEVKAPSGYVRTKPIAVEIYSDKVTYYKEGDRDKRVLAAIYEEPAEHQTENGTKPQDKISLARVNAENVPIKLAVEKVKESGDVTFRIGSRVEGNLTEIGGNPELEYAYSNGQYLGYAYRKGTLEELKALKDAGEKIEIVYENGQFAGYGYVTRVRNTEDDDNRYVAGAKMTLFDAIELTPSGDTEDHAFEGLQINRNNSGNVLEMFVKKGYAGSKTELVKEKNADGKEILTDCIVGVDKDGNAIIKEGYVWKSDTVERPDTDILYYDLDSLSVTWTENVDNRQVLYGWDKNHQKAAIAQIESDKQNYDRTDTPLSIYAFHGGQAVLEFVGGDFTKLSYDSRNKILKGDFAQLEYVTRIREWKMGDGTVVYHLDREGNRDAMVDPYTGMAYVLEPKLDAEGNHVADRVLVWPVNIAKDQYGNIVSRDKITTSRIATVGENQDGYREKDVLDVVNHSGHDIPEEERPSYVHSESGYITGTWDPDGEEESHRETTLNTNKKGQNMNGEILSDDNNGSFLKDMEPIYDEHGLVLYYQRSNSTYDKGTELYDRNGDFVRYKDSDNLEEYNRAAYRLEDHETLYDGLQDAEEQTQERLYHRLGECYILENTWMTSDKTPNDPFTAEETAGQADLLKRLPAGNYILEELAVPAGEGYTKAMPTGVTVNETAECNTVTVKDDTTKIYIQKTDAPADNRTDILNMEQADKDGNYKKEGESENHISEYGSCQVSGARIALYPAKYAVDLSAPEGYRLDKLSSTPYIFETTNSRAGNIERTEAAWTTGEVPVYVEGIPAGYYILEEISAPEEDGFIKADPIYVQIESNNEIQPIIMKDDHTKLAVWKYTVVNGRQESLPRAEFALYEAKVDGDGEIILENGLPQYDSSKMIVQWTSDDAGDYTETINLKEYANTSGKNRVSGFTSEFETMYSSYGINGTGFGWSVERTAARSSTDSNVWILEDGKHVVTGEGTVTFPSSMSKEERDGFKAAYAEDGGKLNLKWAVTRTAKVTQITKTDAADAGGMEQKYPSVADIELEIQETGKKVLANVRYNGKSFEYQYKFDYTKLSVNAYANSWLTADGLYRIDYLPVEGKYVLVETQAPDGFSAALPKAIEVREMPEVQLYKVANEQNALLISKQSVETAKEFAGNQMSLYRADESGKLTESDDYLVDTWISGTDGIYEELDAVNGLIPSGFEEGDLKPHYIHNLPDGKYFLKEVQAAAYYTALEPIEIDYAGGRQIQIVKAVNHPVKGKLVITKTDGDGKKLNGVVFELWAYEEGKTVDGFPRQISDTNGIVTVTDLPVGNVKADGTISPYIYKLKELTPPSGYAANNAIYHFKFDNGKESYGKDPAIGLAVHEMEISNEKTRLSIEKKDLTKLNDSGVDGLFVDGAVLALYKVDAITAEGQYSYDETGLFEQWTSSKTEGPHILEGLIAGQTYVLVEKTAPKGYTLMRPILITVSADGRAISSVSNNLSIVKADRIQESMDNPDRDSIAAVTVKGRTVLRTEIAVLNEGGDEILRFAGTDGIHVLNEKDGIEDGRVYTFAEHTFYSDGSDAVTGKVTRRIRMGEDGFIYNGRAAEQPVIQITGQDGQTLSQFTPTDETMELVIDNQINPENPAVIVRNRNGESGEPIETSQPIINTVTYYNPAPVAKDIEIRVTLDAEILDPYGGRQSGNMITWKVSDVAPYTQGSVSFASYIEDKTALETSVRAAVTIDNVSYETAKSVPLKKENRLTIYNELTGSGKEIYKADTSVFTVHLWDEKGNELAGTYSYTGSHTGTIRSGESIGLSGNEFIMIDPVFRNCRYEIVRQKDGHEVEEHNSSGTISADGTGTWYTRAVSDTSERQIFTKEETYILTERTCYTDGEERISNRFSFTLDDKVSISAIGGYDQITKAVISKTDITTGEELPGNHLEIIDKDGNTVDTWISGDSPHEIEGLVPGETYVLRETSPADGFSYAEDIRFTVNQDGTTEQVLMEDRPTHLVVSKQDITNGEELPGAHLQILDTDGRVVDSWVSTDKPHEIVGKLIAEKTYTLREAIPADGFVLANDIEFTVSRDGRIDQVVMKDDTTKVRIHKLKYGATAPVPGSLLQILNADKTPAMYQGKEIFITTGEDYTELEKILLAGETYWLHEVKPATGYAYAEDVRFTVSTNGKVDTIIMEDRPTAVILSKKEITGNEELPGNHMQLIDKKEGTVIEQWISGEEPHQIIGRLESGHEYTLMEIRPADGYAYAENIDFTVNRDGTPNYVEMRNDVTKAEFLKIDSRNKEPLSGAEFELFDENGKLVDNWVSTAEPHKIYGKLKAGENYVLHEVKVPAGYQRMADIAFTANLSAEVLTIIAENTRIPSNTHGSDDSEYTIQLRKIGKDGMGLSGAAFKAVDAAGRSLSVTRYPDGNTFRITVGDPQVITIKEIHAPEGYEQLDGEYRIRILRDGTAVPIKEDEHFYQDDRNQFLFYVVNFHETPEIPTIPDHPEGNKGRIMASYDKNIKGFGKYRLIYDKSTIDLTTKTGDNFPAAVFAVFICSIAGILGVIYMQYKKKKTGSKKKSSQNGKETLITAALIAGITAVSISSFWQIRSYAAEENGDAGNIQYREKLYVTDTDDPEKQNPDFPESLTVEDVTYVLDSISYEVESKKKAEPPAENIKIVTSVPFIDETENHMPEKKMEEGEVTYYLKSYETIDMKMDARTEPVSDTITYNGISVESQVPELAKLSVTDSVTGEDVEVAVPLISTEYSETRWESGFEFPITVINYEAHIFDLNGIDIPLQESTPLKGYEKELLQMIGVSEENYRINVIEWNGDTYMDQGVLCRDLKATGDMLVYDCKATYSGIANLPEVDAKAVQAVYTDRPAESSSKELQEYIYTMKATAKYTNATEPLEKKGFWEKLIDFITNPVVVAMVLTLLLVVLIIWLLRRKRKNEEQKLLYISDGEDEDETY